MRRKRSFVTDHDRLEPRKLMDATTADIVPPVLPMIVIPPPVATPPPPPSSNLDGLGPVYSPNMLGD